MSIFKWPNVAYQILRMDPVMTLYFPTLIVKVHVSCQFQEMTHVALSNLRVKGPTMLILNLMLCVKFKACPVYFFYFFFMSVRYMSHFDFKKLPIHPVECQGQGPQHKGLV